MSTSKFGENCHPANENLYVQHSWEYMCTTLSIHSTAYHSPPDHRKVNISDTQAQSIPDNSDKYI